MTGTHTHAKPFLLVGLAAAAGLWGCSSGSTEPQPDPSVATTLTVVEGEGLQGPVGTVLPEGPTVEVLDQHGEPMEGVTVSFRVLEGEGSTPFPSRSTNENGRARTVWILGEEAGATQRMEAGTGSLSVEIQATAVQAVAGESYLGRKGYTEFLPGSLPLVLSAPHGGDLTPAEIPDRSYGTMARDTNTRELALKIREAVKNATGFYPHIILSHLRRTKLDPNREVVEAAQGDPEAIRAWWEFQIFIERAQALVEESHGEGFYIDLHGHGHTIQRLELGYLLSTTDLLNSNETLSDPQFISKSSVRTLGEKPEVVFADLIRGPRSLGTLLEDRGFPATPSQTQPHSFGDPYFTGGYNTARHGSRDGGTVSGVQIECNWEGVRDNLDNRAAFAQALTTALEEYFPAHFGMPLAPAGAGAANR